MIYPMLAMVFLVFLVMFCTLYIRVTSIRSGRVKLSYFKSYQEALTDDVVINSSRHFSNLFEMPVLFYAACLTCMYMQYESWLVISLGWLYVLFRCAHAYIQMTYNNVIHRLAAFMKSNACLLAIWVLIGIRQVNG